VSQKKAKSSTAAAAKAGKTNEHTGGEPVSFDEKVRNALAFCQPLSEDFAPYRNQLTELQTRLSKGRLHFAVLGQFNRGKSTFINALLGIKTLPTSVLPLTSVPTVIEYGTKQSCRIRFLDGKEDLVVNDSAERIESSLRQFVAEENNPQNRFGVKDAIITSNSPLLLNGTVLIDTPGFGSTHLHNTQTTLDLLAECDAAVFLLSADPPMTQVEMEFLKQVKDYIPRLFFCLNKVDLLTPDGLDEVDNFIKKILYRELGFTDVTLFHTSAKTAAQAASQDEKDEHWINSGLEEVKKEILDFMIREKYFTLSEALRDKYREAMSSIKSLLEKKLDEKLTPLMNTRQELAAMLEDIQAVSLELESQMRACDQKRETLKTFVNGWKEKNLEAHKLSINKALELLLNGAYFPDEAASIASTVLPRHAADLGMQLLGAAFESANKAMLALIINHREAATHLQTHVLPDSENIPLTEKLFEKLEIAMRDHEEIFDSTPFPTPQPQALDIFRKKAARFEAIKIFYEPLCDQRIEHDLDKATRYALSVIETTWEKLQRTIGAPYQKLIDSLKQIYAPKQELLDKECEKERGEITFLKDKLKECKVLN
jgi:GTPase Era involved in 16S rRNA processing